MLLHLNTVVQYWKKDSFCYGQAYNKSNLKWDLRLYNVEWTAALKIQYHVPGQAAETTCVIDLTCHLQEYRVETDINCLHSKFKNSIESDRNLKHFWNKYIVEI